MEIEFHGDSTQVGVEVWGGAASTTKYPPHVTVSQLVKFYHGDSHTITCHAKGGSQAQDALTQNNFYPAGNFAAHVAQSDADIIVANWGINDVYTSGNTASAHSNRFAQMKNACDAKGITFIAQTPNPILSTGHNQIMVGFNAAVKAIPGIAVIDIYDAITKWYPRWSLHLSDSVHPNGIMYRQIGDWLYAALKSRIV
jgi:lysophospholipase L1-like esterase